MARRILEYFDRIDQSAGKASRMDLLRIAGNEANLNRMVGYLIAQRLVVEGTNQDESITPRPIWEKSFMRYSKDTNISVRCSQTWAEAGLVLHRKRTYFENYQ